jgi:DHA2 family multidrug resistance protein
MLIAERRVPPNKWLVTLAISFGTLMGSIDASIVNVALPQIRGAVGATLQESTWVTTGFIIATVIMLPLTGFVGRLFGQKHAYLACLTLFVASSVLCGLAWSLPSLVIFRALQGLGAGALTPIEQAILRRTFPPEEQGMAMAIFTMVIVVGPTIGPTLGGYIVDHHHWSWIFFINIPVGVIGFLMVWHVVEEPPDLAAADRAAAEAQRRKLDWPGLALLCAGLATLQYLLEDGQSRDWFESTEISGCALVAGVCLSAFVVRELHAPAPIVNLRLFKDPVFSSGVLVGVIVFSVILANMFLLSLFTQELLGFTATDAGMALMPRTIVMVATMPIVGRLYGRVSPRALIAAGLLCSFGGIYLMGGVAVDTGIQDLIGGLMLQGLGTSLIFVPLNTVLFENVPRTRVADAAGVNLMLRHIGSSLGLAMLASLVPRYTAQAREALAAHLFAERPEVIERLAQIEGAMIGRGLDRASAQTASLRLLADTTLRQATIIAFDRLFLLSALLFLLALPLLLILRSTPSRGVPGSVQLEEV